MSELYDTDIVIWSERQAALLRQRAAGKLVNEADIDWPNLAEEIEDVGRSELRSCRSLLRQALRHMLKAEAWPLARDAPSWRADAIDFRRQARVCARLAEECDDLRLAERLRRMASDLLAKADDFEEPPSARIEREGRKKVALS